MGNNNRFFKNGIRISILVLSILVFIPSLGYGVGKNHYIKIASNNKDNIKKQSALVNKKISPDSLTYIKARGKGRNLSQDTWSFGLKHSSMEYKTCLARRQLVTSNGTTTTINDIAVNDIKNLFPTYLHMEQLIIRSGLSDYLEISAGIGVAFDELSDLKPCFTGGIRLNLFEIETNDKLNGFYGAVLGEYNYIDSFEEYDSPDGIRWGKDSEIQTVITKLEIGISHSNMNFFLGGSYSAMYDEESDRTLLNNLPSGIISAFYSDTLDEDNGFGILGGIVYFINQSLSINLEGELGDRKGVSLSMEYHF